MRILLACHRYPPDGLGGVERIVQELSRDLPALGDAVSIVTRRMGPVAGDVPELVREPLGRATLYRLTGPSGSLLRPLLHQARLDQLFTVAMVEAAPDVVHFLHLLNLSPGFLEIACRQRAPIVISLQDFYFACPLVTLTKTNGQPCQGARGGLECAATCFAHEGAAALQRWNMRALYFRGLLDLADRIICPSRHVAEFFVQHYGLRPEQVRLIPNGIVPMPRPPGPRPTPRQRGRLRLVFMGVVAAHKGVRLLLQALELAQLPRVQLDVNGPTHDQPDYVESLRQFGAGIPGLDLRINGPFDNEQLPELLQDADCLVVPSLVPETFALVSREALWQGVPILVSRIGALPEAILAGVNGLAFDPTQPFELAEHLCALWEKPALLDRLRRGAEQSRVATTTEHAATMHALYAEVQAEALRRPIDKAPLLAELAAMQTLLLQYGFG